MAINFYACGMQMDSKHTYMLARAHMNKVLAGEYTFHHTIEAIFHQKLSATYSLAARKSMGIETDMQFYA